MTQTASAVGQLTADTLTIEAATGVTYAYRRFGTRSGSRPPLLFLQHFSGNLDNWDPLLVDTIAAHTEVVLVDNTGVGSSSGRAPVTVTEMTRDAIALADALALDRLDLLGYSLGGNLVGELLGTSPLPRRET